MISCYYLVLVGLSITLKTGVKNACEMKSLRYFALTHTMEFRIRAWSSVRCISSRVSDTNTYTVDVQMYRKTLIHTVNMCRDKLSAYTLFTLSIDFTWAMHKTAKYTRYQVYGSSSSQSFWIRSVCCFCGFWFFFFREKYQIYREKKIVNEIGLIFFWLIWTNWTVGRIWCMKHTHHQFTYRTVRCVIGVHAQR